MNPATLASIRATAERLTERPIEAGDELGHPPEREDGMPFHKFEAACRRWASKARRYVCPVCEEFHDSEYKAEQCCPPEIETIWVDGATGKEYGTASELAAALAKGIAGRSSGPASVPRNNCPVCGGANTSPHEAVECCLWKDIDAPRRWAIAAALENGSTWTDELSKLEGGAI